MKIEKAIFEVSKLSKYYVCDLKHTRSGKGVEHLVQVGVKIKIFKISKVVWFEITKSVINKFSLLPFWFAALSAFAALFGHGISQTTCTVLESEVHLPTLFFLFEDAIALCFIFCRRMQCIIKRLKLKYRHDHPLNTFWIVLIFRI